MKKNYIIPEMETIEIKVQQMLASSLELGDPGSANEAEAPEFKDIFDSF